MWVDGNFFMKNILESQSRGCQSASDVLMVSARSVRPQPPSLHRGPTEGSRHRAEEKLRPLQRRTHPCESQHRLNVSFTPQK